MLFVPGISAVRPLIRVLAFGVALVAWAGIVQSGRARPGASTFPPNGWLKVAIGWLLLLILHWHTNSIAAGVAHALLYISVFSPAFWAPAAVVSQRQVSRLKLHGREAAIQANGSLLNPLDVYNGEYWGFEKIGEFLPFDYMPPTASTAAPRQ